MGFRAIVIDPMNRALNKVASVLGAGAAILLFCGLLLVAFGPWVLHIVYCLAAERAVMFGILILGVVIPPIGWIHGWVIFFRWIFS